MLKAVQNDINKREELLNFVFEHRQAEIGDPNQRGAGFDARSIAETTEKTSSLTISAITTSALPTANVSQSINSSNK